MIRPTPTERAMGRLMRAPDHDGGDGGDGGAADDAGGGDADQGGADSGADQGNDGADGDDTSLLGSAAADDGAGDRDEGGEGDGKGDDDDQSKADGPPEAYDLKVTVKDAEGKDVDVPIDAELLEKATPVLKEIGLTNDQANQVAALVPEIQSQIEQKLAQTQADSFSAMKADWAKEAQGDKEIGGSKWKETEALAAKALAAFGAPSEIKEVDGKNVETNPFRVLLNETGLGNHPVMIRMFRNIGEKLGEGDFVRGEGGGAQKQDRVRTLYPNDKPKEVQAK